MAEHVAAFAAEAATHDDPAIGLVASADATGLVIQSASWVVGPSHRIVGAVFGPVTADEAGRIVARLRTSDDPGHTAQDVPWAAIARRADATVVATASMMLNSGIFHNGTLQEARHGAQPWVVATDPGSIAQAQGHTPAFDLDFLREFAVMTAPVPATPFTGVTRTPAGDTVRRSPTGAVSSTQWCGPETVPEPWRGGPTLVADYLHAFDGVVADLVARAGPIITTVSGGLDSTFMLAAIAATTPERTPIHAYCHSPVVAAHSTPDGNWDPDDMPFAEIMTRSAGSDVHLHPLRNDAGVHPLDVAADVSQRRSWPVSGVGNVGWLNEFATIATTAGTPLRFFGTHGNAAFSDSHRYALHYYLHSRHPWRALWLAAPTRGERTELRAMIRTRLRAPLRHPSPDPAVAAARRARLGLRSDTAVALRPTPSRRTYLAWLTGRLRALPAANNPAFAAGNLVADPFASRTMIEFAAAIEPHQWQRGHLDRALARRLGQGRVPDGIRLRRRRGGQGRDTLYTIRATPGRLLDSLDETSAAVWDDLNINREILRDTALSILDPSTTPAHGWVEDVLRTAALGEFVTAMRN